MKIINNHKYSKTSFNDYKLRVILQIYLIKPKEDDYSDFINVTLYTTQTNINNVISDINNNIINHDKIKSYNIIHTATKEQDDLSSKFINETLNNDW